MLVVPVKISHNSQTAIAYIDEQLFSSTASSFAPLDRVRTDIYTRKAQACRLEAKVQPTKKHVANF
jgi:hypothetical protein